MYLILYKYQLETRDLGISQIIVQPSLKLLQNKYKMDICGT